MSRLGVCCCCHVGVSCVLVAFDLDWVVRVWCGHANVACAFKSCDWGQQSESYVRTATQCTFDTVCGVASVKVILHVHKVCHWVITIRSQLSTFRHGGSPSHWLVILYMALSKREKGHCGELAMHEIAGMLHITGTLRVHVVLHLTSYAIQHIADMQLHFGFVSPDQLCREGLHIGLKCHRPPQP